MPFKSPLDIRSVRGNDDRFFLLSPLVYVTRAGALITVPLGFITDFASVPALLQSLLPKTGKYRDAAVVHDYLYRCARCTFSREQADQVFLQAMEELNVSSWQRNALFWGVRLFGARYWKRQQ